MQQIKLSNVQTLNDCKCASISWGVNFSIFESLKIWKLETCESLTVWQAWIIVCTGSHLVCYRPLVYLPFCVLCFVYRVILRCWDAGGYLVGCLLGGWLATGFAGWFKLSNFHTFKLSKFGSRFKLSNFQTSLRDVFKLNYFKLWRFLWGPLILTHSPSPPPCK